MYKVCESLGYIPKIHLFLRRHLRIIELWFKGSSGMDELGY